MPINPLRNHRVNQQPKKPDPPVKEWTYTHGKKTLRWTVISHDYLLTCPCPKPVVCRHRTLARQHRRNQVTQEYQAALPDITRILRDLLVRAETGEFVGQEDGNIFRAADLADQFRVPVEDVEYAAEDLDECFLVAGVIIPSPSSTWTRDPDFIQT